LFTIVNAEKTTIILPKEKLIDLNKYLDGLKLLKEARFNKPEITRIFNILDYWQTKG